MSREEYLQRLGHDPANVLFDPKQSIKRIVSKER